jgi:hypothetical protein
MDTGDLLKWGGLAVVAYLVWQELSTGTLGIGTSAAAPAPTPAPTPAPAPTPTPGASVAYVPPTITQQLVAIATAAGNANSLNADQWNYYYSHLSGVSGAVQDPLFSSVFWPNGRPADMTTAPKMTAAQWVAALQAAGVTGLSGLSRGLQNPYQRVVDMHRRAGAGSHWTM